MEDRVRDVYEKLHAHPGPVMRKTTLNTQQKRHTSGHNNITGKIVKKHRLEPWWNKWRVMDNDWYADLIPKKLNHVKTNRNLQYDVNGVKE